MGVAPVDLAVGRQIVVGIGLERAALIAMRQPDQAAPLRLRQYLLLRWDRSLVRKRPVARQNARPEKLVGGVVNGELKVAKRTPFRDPSFEGCHQTIDATNFHAAFNRTFRR